ncbi:MAG: Uma2 family endonuclease [Gammaproteobacteria bacterium]|nr:Uma2 family endonuclease [Gammaproteobacteria bacterium]
MTNEIGISENEKPDVSQRIFGLSGEKQYSEGIDDEEANEMGSCNHSAIQANLAFLLKNTGDHSVFIELSLDIGSLDLSKFNIKLKEEIKPDVCIYSKRKINRLHDISKMSEMPLSAVEILSPAQGIQAVLDKFKVYFALGVKSCWLVEPVSGAVTVFSSPDKAQAFVANELTDEVLDLRLPVKELFE